MGLAEVQAALARLFTDPSLRERFFDDPQAVGSALGLSPSEANGLSGLSPRDVGRFASSLRHKRVGDARKVIPLTARALGPTFAACFLAAISGPPTPGRHLDDARTFARFLSSRERETSADPPWIPDLVRYEIAFADAHRMGVGLLWRRFRFPMGRVVASFQDDTTRAVIPPRSSLGFWLRVPGRSGIIHHII